MHVHGRNSFITLTTSNPFHGNNESWKMLSIVEIQRNSRELQEHVQRVKDILNEVNAAKRKTSSKSGRIRS
jgi:hypothetical protein